MYLQSRLASPLGVSSTRSLLGRLSLLVTSLDELDELVDAARIDLRPLGVAALGVNRGSMGWGRSRVEADSRSDSSRLNVLGVLSDGDGILRQLLQPALRFLGVLVLGAKLS